MTNISCEAFNNYFSTIGAKTVAHIPSSASIHNDNFPDCIYSFTFSNVDDSFVLRYLASLPDQSKNDILNFDTKLLKLSANYIFKSLSFIINTSLKIGHCPPDWKLARVSPAFKGKGYINDETHFRPF